MALIRPSVRPMLVPFVGNRENPERGAMKADFIVNFLSCSLLCLMAAPAVSQQIRIQAALPPDIVMDFGDLAASLPAEAEIAIRRESEAPAIVDQVVQGKIDIAIVPTTSLKRVAPAFAIFDVPFAVAEQRFNNLFSWDSRTEKYFEASLEKAGLGQIGPTLYRGTTVIRSNKPVRSPRDFRGSRIGLLQGSTIGQIVELAGAQPVAFTDARSMVWAFEKGEVDAVEVPLDYDWFLMDEPTYVTKTKHRYAAQVVIYNQANYARLSPSVREQIELAIKGQVTRASYLAVKREESHHGTELKIDENIRNEWSHLVEKTEWRTTHSKIDKSLLAELRDPTEETIYPASYEGGPELGWNAWFQSGTDMYSDQITKDRDYDIVLDLGRGEFPGALSTNADSGIPDEIERSPAGSGISLLVRPIISGDILVARADQPLVAKIFRIERSKLAAKDSDRQIFQRAKEENLPLSEISKALSVGAALTWPVVAMRTGCAQIAFSIWSVSGLRPLDQIIVNVPVVAANGHGVPDCKADISGGLDTLLSLDTLNNPTQADAALHFFDIGSKGESDARTVAVYVARSELEAANRNGQSPPVYAWTLKSELSRFLGQPDKLQHSIASAHGAIDKPRPYDSAVRQLSAAIFNARDRSEDAAASHAKESLKQLGSLDEPPVVITRYFDRNGSMQYLPLGLLAADATERVLSRRMTLVQPLESTRALSSDTCVDNWDFAIPDTLEGAHAEAAELLAEKDWRLTGPGTNWYRDNLELLNFLKDRGGEAPPSSGLVLLAHHHNGSITYSRDGNPDRILNVEVRRWFGRGSFAVLAACETSGISVESRDFMDHLFGNGVDAVVTSPFQVDAAFGTRFAVSFATVTKAAKQNGEPARLMDLFNRAIDLTMQAYRDQPGYSDMALEFQIVGNHQVRLCSPTIANH